MKHIGILTSGGDAPGMNACIRAIVRAAGKENIRVTGFIRGYAGVLDNQYRTLDELSVSGIISSGGTILLSARCLEMMEEAGCDKAAQNIKNLGIDGLIVIGGDGTFRGAADLSARGIATIGIPGTIDGDLSYTDYTIGYDTAVTTIMESMDQLADTMRSHDRICVVEAMGRNCGLLSLYGGIAGGAQSILLPEQEVDLDEVVTKIETARDAGKTHALIVVSEGLRLREGGQKGTAMGAAHIAQLIASRIPDADVRPVVLGHLQRGGRPTARDRIAATNMGVYAVELLSQGKVNRVIGQKGGEVFDMDLFESQKVPKTFNQKQLEIAKLVAL